jgi:hypothetical protein
LNFLGSCATIEAMEIFCPRRRKFCEGLALGLYGYQSPLPLPLPLAPFSAIRFILRPSTFDRTPASRIRIKCRLNVGHFQSPASEAASPSSAPLFLFQPFSLQPSPFALRPSTFDHQFQLRDWTADD